MARPRKTSKELILSGAPANKIAARIAEENSNPSVPDTTARTKWLPLFLEAIAAEKSTFSKRVVPGQTLMLELGGVPFNWREEHPLTMARKYASYLVAIPEATAPLPILREECSQFLAELETGHEQGFYLDPEAANSLEVTFNAFDRHGWVCAELAIFDFVQYVAWKKPDGTRRYCAEDRESFKHRNVLEEALKLSDQIV
jgi:hypothetical protein